MKNLVLISSAFLFLSFPTVFSAQATETEIIGLPKGCVIQDGNILERKNCSIEWSDRAFSDALGKIFRLTSVPSGISLVFENAGEDEIRIYSNPDDFTVRSLLDEIAKFDSRYQWKETNGVVNVFPQNDYSILDVKIKRFKAERMFPSELREKLTRKKEFQKYLQEKNLLDKVPDPQNKHGWIFIGAFGKPSPRNRISIDLKDATVREILNEIVRRKGRGTWKYQEYDLISDNELFHLYRLEF